MDADVDLTVSEASYVVNRPSEAINRAVDRDFIEAGRHGVQGGPVPRRRIGPAELRYLALAEDVERDLTPVARRRLYDALRHLPSGEHQVHLGRLAVRLDDVDRLIAARLRRLEDVKAHVEPGPGGEPVLRGTGTPVYVIAGLSAGQTIEEILQDYPPLTREQVEAAIEYARARPKPGRPYPARSFKRMLGDLADAMGDDREVPESDVPGPRLIP